MLRVFVRNHVRPAGPRRDGKRCSCDEGGNILEIAVAESPGLFTCPAP
jgi:hypothetical protein